MKRFSTKQKKCIIHKRYLSQPANKIDKKAEKEQIKTEFKKIITDDKKQNKILGKILIGMFAVAVYGYYTTGEGNDSRLNKQREEEIEKLETELRFNHRKTNKIFEFIEEQLNEKIPNLSKSLNIPQNELQKELIGRLETSKKIIYPELKKEGEEKGANVVIIDEEK